MALPERGKLVMALLLDMALDIVVFASGDGIWMRMAGMFGRAW